MIAFVTRKTSLGIAVAAGLLAVCGPDPSLLRQGMIVAPAAAIVGRPATPMSYAGVARRTTARAVTTTAVVAAPKCVQTVDAYGRVVTRCY
jgi:hypothetical protein